MKPIASDKQIGIIGLGMTGLSCVRFLSALGKHITVFDTRENPPGLDELEAGFPDVRIFCGALDAEKLKQMQELVVSPGVPVADPAIQEAKSAGVEIRGDIDVFAQFAKAPIVGITGSNGKSTVTTLVGEMAKASGVKVAVGGNIGIPALDLIHDDVELYVLELSSFQLETTRHLGAETAVLLNISEDHMDRYESKLAYLQAKQRIFLGCKNVVINDDEALSRPLMSVGMKPQHFGIANPDINKYSTMDDEEGAWICHGFDRLINTSQLKVRGKHNISNILAALAIGRTVGLQTDAMISAIREFEGLRHRCQWVRELDGVTYVNDSKGTNVGATTAAIESLGLSSSGKIVLLAGGEGKGADFSPLKGVVEKFGRMAVLIGTDAKTIAKALADAVVIKFADSLRQAVGLARDNAEPGDIVLFSPACASFDMFKDYKDRGDQFVKEVNEL